MLPHVLLSSWSPFSFFWDVHVRNELHVHLEDGWNDRFLRAWWYDPSYSPQVRRRAWMSFAAKPESLSPWFCFLNASSSCWVLISFSCSPVIICSPPRECIVDLSNQTIRRNFLRLGFHEQEHFIFYIYICQVIFVFIMRFVMNL